MSRQVVRLAALVGVMLVPRGAGAQEPPPPDPADTAKFKFGPVYFDSTFTLRNVGTDSNVFAENENPREDFTATVGGGLRGGIRLGWARVTFTNSSDFVYYHKYRGEGGANQSKSLRLELAMGKVHSYLSGDFLNTKERPKREIDTRAKRSHPTYLIGSEITLGLRTKLGVDVSRTQVEFEPGETFLGVNLAEALNQKTESASLSFKYSLTPLTTLTMLGAVARTRFDIADFRDGDSIDVAARFDFHASALLSGSASIGIRDFTALGPFVPSNRGPTASVSLTYSGLGSTRLGGTLTRNIEFSVEDQYPYFVLTGGTLTLSQRIAGPVDLSLSAGREQLDYQARVALDLPELVETMDTATVSLGYRLNSGMRWGFNLEVFERRSTTRASREHRGTRMYASVTYGQ